ncbi:MAG: PfkB family carbohydrate kinase [Pseudomonadota bacterium]
MTAAVQGHGPGRPTGPVLCVASQVVAGHVGLGATVPALAASGIEAWPLPTVTLSGHAATAGVRGRRATGEEIAALAEGLEAAGVLPRLAGLALGYLGSVQAAQAAADLADRAAALAPGATILTDPVLGDDGRLYLPAEVGEVYRARLIPRAALATPNLFELGWLTGRPVDDLPRIVAAAEALRAEGPAAVFVTSVAPSPGRIGALAVWEGGAALAHGPETPRRINGAGDFLAARLLAETLAGASPPEAAARAVGAAAALAAQARAQDRDDLPVASARWLDAPAAQLSPL